MRRLLILLLVIQNFYSASAQEEIMPTAPRGYIQSGVCLQMWRQETIIEEPILQVTIPVHIAIPVNSSLGLTFDYSYARTDWDWQRTNMSGFNDPYIQGNLMLWDKKLLLFAGMGIPVGKTRLNYDEYFLSTILSLNIFRFRSPVYGQGFHGKLGALVAYPVMDGLVVGAGGSFVYRRKFIPIFSNNWNDQGYPADGYFDPGEEMNAHLGFDLSLSENMKIMVDGIFTYFQKDKYNSPDYVFQSGMKVTLNGGYFYRYDEQYVWALFNYRTKNNNSALQALQFGEEKLNTNRPQLDVNLIWKAFALQGGGVQVLIDGRFYAENEVGLSSAQAIGGGFGGNYRFSYTTVLDFYVKYMVGQRLSSVDTDKLNIEGMDVGITFRYEF